MRWIVIQILQRRRAAALSRPCALPDFSDEPLSKRCGYSLLPRLRAVTGAQKVTLDALYQRYLKSVGLLARLFCSVQFLFAGSYCKYGIVLFLRLFVRHIRLKTHCKKQ